MMYYSTFITNNKMILSLDTIVIFIILTGVLYVIQLSYFEYTPIVNALVLFHNVYEHVTLFSNNNHLHLGHRFINNLMITLQ